MARLSARWLFPADRANNAPRQRSTLYSRAKPRVPRGRAGELCSGGLFLEAARYCACAFADRRQSNNCEIAGGHRPPLKWRRLLQDEIEISVEDIIGPVPVATSQYSLAAGEQCGADGAAGERSFVERFRKSFGGVIADRPVGAHVVRNAAAHQRLSDTGRFVGLNAGFLHRRNRTSPNAPGLACIEEHEQRQITDSGQI